MFASTILFPTVGGGVLGRGVPVPTQGGVWEGALPHFNALSKGDPGDLKVIHWRGAMPHPQNLKMSTSSAF